MIEKFTPYVKQAFALRAFWRLLPVAYYNKVFKRKDPVFFIVLTYFVDNIFKSI